MASKLVFAVKPKCICPPEGVLHSLLILHLIIASATTKIYEHIEIQQSKTKTSFNGLLFSHPMSALEIVINIKETPCKSARFTVSEF